MKVSVRKISEITGFSPATVSNALNYKKGVNAETSAKKRRCKNKLSPVIRSVFSDHFMPGTQLPLLKLCSDKV